MNSLSNIEFEGRQIPTIFAALELFQKEAEKGDMVKAFPRIFWDDHLQPLSKEDIDDLRWYIQASVLFTHNDGEYRWQQLMEMVNEQQNTPLTRLILQLNSVVEDESLSAEKAFNILSGHEDIIAEIKQDKIRQAVLTDFNKREEWRNNKREEENIPVLCPFSLEGYRISSQVTRDYVRNECQGYDVNLDDQECDRVITEIQEAGQAGTEISNVMIDVVYGWT